MHELEARLEAAAPFYAFPETPDLAGAARARLTQRRPRSDPHAWQRDRGDAKRLSSLCRS